MNDQRLLMKPFLHVQPRLHHLSKPGGRVPCRQLVATFSEARAAHFLFPFCFKQRRPSRFPVQSLHAVAVPVLFITSSFWGCHHPEPQGSPQDASHPSHHTPSSPVLSDGVSWWYIPPRNQKLFYWQEAPLIPRRVEFPTNCCVC